MFFLAVDEAELRFGAGVLRSGRRRELLIWGIEAILHEAFDERVLPFDSKAARIYAEIAALRRLSGRMIPPADCQVAAIALSRGMSVETGNVGEFDHIGIEIVNPWSPRGGRPMEPARGVRPRFVL